MFEAKKAVDFQRVLAKIAKWKCIFTSITFTTNSYLFAKFLFKLGKSGLGSSLL